MQDERCLTSGGHGDLRDLLAVPDAGDAGEVVVGEDGVVVGEQGGALPLGERGGEAEADAGGEAEASAGARQRRARGRGRGGRGRRPRRRRSG
jgi:hypothetical protein